MKNFELNKKHMEYFEKVVPELVQAEETIKRIKGSKEWKRAYDYFSLLKHRGILKVRPTKENHYKIELSDGFISLNELENIVTEEQMEQIKKLLK